VIIEVKKKNVFKAGVPRGSAVLVSHFAMAEALTVFVAPLCRPRCTANCLPAC
jgi:hypothetical protein